MRKTIKVFATICAVISFLIFVSIIYLELSIPDRINLIEGKSYDKTFFGMEILNFDFPKSVNRTQNEDVLENEAEVMLLNIIPVKKTIITNSKRKYVVLGGELFGVKLYTDGIIVVDIDDVETDDGVKNPAKEAGIKIGDIIKTVDGVAVTSTAHLTKILQNSNGKQLRICIERNGKSLEITFKTMKESQTGKYCAGLWVRDSTAGLGTVSFYNPENNSFGGLGHAIYDVDTNDIMPLKSGEMCLATINGIYKSTKGNIGELSGIISRNSVGTIHLNHETGVYGFTEIPTNSYIPVATKQEVKTGKAQLLCTVNDKKEYYDIEIIRIFKNPKSVNKDMIIKITDDNLLEITGGIVQGMSGSPIVQNGMLVGAVTHVFVNNPKQGYAIMAERMLETSTCQEMQKQEQFNKAS